VPAAINFSNEGEIRDWLANKPRDVAVVFAARMALRIAPLLAGLRGPRRGGVGGDIALSVFRAMATPWVAGQYPAHSTTIRAVAATACDAALFAARDADLSAARDAAAAAGHAAATAASVTAEDTCFAATRACSAAADATSFADVRATARADGEIIDNGASASALAALPLWLTERPAWARDSLPRLEEALLKENQDWQVWTHWYRARLEGQHANEALEVARVLIADEIWTQGPHAANAEIARLIAEYDAG
jgi:hypothetical protein